jgi:RNA polymerase-binding transcription factor DksA
MAALDRVALGAQLRARLTELRGRTARLEARLRATVPSVHEAPPADDQLLDALDEELRTEIEQVEGALSRMETSAWGICIGCEESIAPARMVAVPWAVRCVDCSG